MRVLVAGATGTLGHYLVTECHRQGYSVRALTRSEKKLSKIRWAVDDVRVGEVTQPETLRGVADDVDVVVSAVGITRQKDGFTYDDVDYQGNVNLLNEALKSGVKKFIYVSVLHVEKMLHLKVVQAKERFVNELRGSGIDHVVLRPNGFFLDMREYLEMARKGRVLLLGGGTTRINPIHAKDVAKACIQAIGGTERDISFGGPTVYAQRELAELAFKALGKKPRMASIPNVVAKFALYVLRLLTPSKLYGPIEFTLSILMTDMVGEIRGTEQLPDFFDDEARAMR